MNIYEQFLQYVKTKQYHTEKMFEYHHEPPHHTGRSDDNSPDNVYVSIQDHILLHQYRWIVYGEVGDKLMFLGRKNDTEEFRKLMNQRRIEVCKNGKSGFWSPDRKIKSGIAGKKGGRKGGGKNTEHQFHSRQMVGNTYGRINGLKNQKSDLVEILSTPITFVHKSGIKVTLKSECANDIARILKTIIPNNIKTSCVSMIRGNKPWGGWVVEGVEFDKRKRNIPCKWASVKGLLCKWGIKVGNQTLYPSDLNYRTSISDTFMELCRLYGNPVGSHSSVSETAREHRV